MRRVIHSGELGRALKGISFASSAVVRHDTESLVMQCARRVVREAIPPDVTPPIVQKRCAVALLCIRRPWPPRVVHYLHAFRERLRQPRPTSHWWLSNDRLVP